MNKIHYMASQLFTIFLGMLPLHVFSQEGSVFINHYFPPNESYTANLGMIYELDGRIMLANERGILIFDGYQWELVPTPDIPTVLYALPQSDRVVVGGRNLLGWVERKTNGEYVFNALKHDSIGIITQIEAVDSFIYFLTPHQIVVAKNNLSQLQILTARPGKNFQLLIPFSGKMYVDDGSPQLSLITANSLKPRINFSLGGKVLFARSYDAKKLFLVTFDNRCYLFDGQKITPFVIEDQAYLSQGAINQVMVVGSYIAFATNHGGCLVVNRSNGRTLHYINYQTGLPDDEIYCMTADPDGGIWLGHFYGLSRADFQLPVRNFSSYPGLQGRPQCISIFQNTLYVGTNEGVFRLVKKASYQAVVTPSVAKSPNIVTRQEEIRETGKSETPVAAEAPVKKGLFARIFGKKKKQEEEKAEKSSVMQNIPASSERKASAPKVTYRLASISYQYEKLQGIGKKCKQLVIFKDELIAVTPDELFRIQKDRATSIAKNVVVNATHVDPARQCIYLATGDGIKNMTAIDKLEDLIPGMHDPVVSLTLIDKTLWAGMEKKILKVNLTQPVAGSKVIRLKGNEKYLLKNVQQTPFVFTASGVYRIVSDTLQLYTGFSVPLKNASKFISQQSDLIWANAGNTWLAISPSDSTKIISYSWLNLFDNISYLSRMDTVLWVIENNQNLYRISLPQLARAGGTFHVFIKKLMGNNGQLFPLERIELSPSENFLKLVVFAPSYIKSATTQYAFFIENLMQQWSNWSPSPEFNMTLPPGRWKVHVKAKNVFGKESEEKIVQIVILKPFYQQWWFYLLIGTIVVLLIGGMVSLRIRYLEREKAILEAKVKERTREIEEQKEEILSQRDALAMQNILILEQKNKIEHINKEITDSIRYAQHIQSSLLPNKAELDKVFKQYFILYKPKDIVSGDFYWARQKGDKTYVAVADCTGHGVPGGFITMLGISFLNEIFLNDGSMPAYDILNRLREKVVGSLIRENQEQQAQDGMDIAFCIIDNKQKKIYFAAANSQAYLIRGQEIVELKGDKMPIGLHVKINESFTESVFEFRPGDELFLFSDGYKDQIGGENEKRLKSAAFKKILLDIYSHPYETQLQFIEQAHEEWKGSYDQTDDILVMGIQL